MFTLISNDLELSNGNGRLFEAGASPAPSARTVFIRDLTDGQAVQAVFLVSARSVRAEEATARSSSR